MRFFKPHISVFLAACLGLAGLVGICPDLHRLTEHGGTGPAHVHRGNSHHSSADWLKHDHGDGLLHQHRSPRNFAKRIESKLAFAHAHEFNLPLDRILSALVQWIDSSFPSSANPGDDSPGHRHHSLPQLLAGGLVEPCLQPEILPAVSRVVLHFFSVPEFLVHGYDWNAQTATRGPPASLS